MVIRYRKSCLGLPLLLRLAGSSLPRALAPAIWSTLLCVYFEQALPSDVLSSFFEHPYPVCV